MQAVKLFRVIAAQLGSAPQFGDIPRVVLLLEVHLREVCVGGGESGIGRRQLFEEILPIQEKLFGDGNGFAYDLAVTYAAVGRNDDAIRLL
ncbi:MAG: hypothetical protein WB983_02265 [Terriglobales bacterium]